MREILFRGKEKNSSKWIYGDLRHISDSHGGYILCIVDNTNGRNNDVTGVEVVPKTVVQYTGLTDKSRTKIFEGDIIEGHRSSQWNHELMRCVITYNRDHFEARYYPRGIHGNYFTYKIMFSKDVVVIGNIYDNPELMEG